MSGPVYKIIEIAGSSDVSLDDAIRGAVSKAAETVRNLRWFEVVETRGHIKDGKVAAYQALLKIGFAIDDGDAND